MPVICKMTKSPKKESRINKKKNSRFSGVLAVISIVGFIEIIMKSFFQVSISEYSSFLWLMIMGIGFIIITKPLSLYRYSKESGMSESAFTALTTFVIGCMAIIAGILSLPFIGITHPILFATMGVISIISIIFIAFQQWIIKE